MDIVLATDNQGYGSALYIDGKFTVGRTGGGTYDKLHAIKERGGKIDSLDSITLWDDFDRWPDNLEGQRTVSEMTEVITTNINNLNAEEATKLVQAAIDVNDDFKGSVTELTTDVKGDVMTVKGARCLMEDFERLAQLRINRNI